MTTKELPNGVYTLQIKTEYGTLNKKIVIER
ncbi:MAG: T9SS type A sorting domain-containing protein [Bacteroidetes bacterium]|nr:T9SS type A sorting domain-containing protein [Bacteroidota bacterium]